MQFWKKKTPPHVTLSEYQQLFGRTAMFLYYRILQILKHLMLPFPASCVPAYSYDITCYCNPCVPGTFKKRSFKEQNNI